MVTNLDDLAATSQKSAPLSDTAKFSTHFADAERKDIKDLDKDIWRATCNDVINGIMTIANGFFAVLNDKRQVVAINETFVKHLGIDQPGALLGLRLGEVVGCIHAGDMPGGCGTSEYCSTCGAAVAIMGSMATMQPQERSCSLTVKKGDQNVDLFFNVRCCPHVIDDNLYVLLFMQDNSMQQYRACLDRTFHHDIKNILCALIGKSELLSLQKQPSEKMQKDLHHIVLRIAQEMEIQNSISKSLDLSYKPLYSEINANSILTEVDQLFHNHPLKGDRMLETSYLPHDVKLKTDFHLVSRIVINMVTNALEATPDCGKVKLSAELHQNTLSYCVWNPGEIPHDIALRIFQRNFSTKADLGRGFGTYSMKLFGEKVLGGSVQFDSSEDSGTIFRFSLITQ